MPAVGQNNRADEQVRRLRQQLQLLQQDAATQQQATLRAEAERAALQRELDSTTTRQKAQDNKLALQSRTAARMQQDIDAQARLRVQAEERASALQAALDAEQKAATALRAELQKIEGMRSTLQDTHAQLLARHRVQAEGLGICIDRNAQLQALGLELLQRYERKGLGAVLLAEEPVLQRGRIALENLVQDYQDKLDAQTLPAAR